jgi:hypothetical protein
MPIRPMTVVLRSRMPTRMDSPAERDKKAHEDRGGFLASLLGGKKIRGQELTGTRGMSSRYPVPVRRMPIERSSLRGVRYATPRIPVRERAARSPAYTPMPSRVMYDRMLAEERAIGRREAALEYREARMAEDRARMIQGAYQVPIANKKRSLRDSIKDFGKSELDQYMNAGR